MKSCEQLEREGEETRARLNETLDELRSRITPGQVVDELVDYARATDGAALARNLKQQIVANPLPLLVVGAGLAWLMMASGRSARSERALVDRSSVRDAGARAAAAAKDMAKGMTDAASTLGDAARGARSAASAAGERMRTAAASSAEAASSLIDTVRTRAGSAYDRTSRATQQAAAAVGDSAAALASRSRDFVAFCKDEPLLLAGLGVAVGAALGATLPVSEAENRLVGEASDDIKERMRRVADKAKQSATAAYEQVTEAMPSAGANESSSGSDARAASPAGQDRTPR